MSSKKVDISSFFSHSVDLANRLLYIGSVGIEDNGTDYAMAEYAIKGLALLDLSAPAGDKPITIIMNNHGGDSYHGMAIYDAIKGCHNHTTIIVYGHAMSMGGLILQAADRRVMAPNARFMMHVGTFGYGHAHPKEVKAWMKDSDQLDKEFEEIIYQKMVQCDIDVTRHRVRQLLEFDTILTAQQTVDLGLADEVLGGKK